MQGSIFEYKINTFSIKEIYLMGGFMSSYLFIPLGFFIIQMTRHYFPLLSVNLLSVKRVSHPEEVWGHRFQLGSWGAEPKGAKSPYVSKYTTIIIDHFWGHFFGSL